MFERNDTLYTAWFWSYVWGWYDLLDNVGLSYWNPDDSTWVYKQQGESNETFYPSNKTFIDLSPFTILFTNGKSGSNLRYKKWNIQTRTPFSATTLTQECLTTCETGDPCIYCIDDGFPYNYIANDSIVHQGYRYILDRVNETISATDLTNNVERDFASYSGLNFIDQNNSAIYAYHGLIFLSNNYKTYGGNTRPSYSYFVSAIDSPVEFAEDVELALIAAQVRRNYFRGIYPEAILEMTSGK